MRALRRKLEEQQGVTALFMALSLSVLFGSAALAVDLGMLATARSEAQNAADAAALAAASAYVYGARVDPDARALAVRFAGENAVRGRRVTLDAGDILVSGDTVRVTVRRPAIPTLFARVLGTTSADVSASAAAAPLTGPAQVPCLLPLTIPDRWVNRRNPRWNPNEGDYYPPLFRRDGTYNPSYVGYATPGERLQIRPQPRQRQFRNGRPRMQPERSFLWLPGDARGRGAVRSRVDGCPDGAEVSYGSGDWLRWYDDNQRAVGDALRAILSDSRYSGHYYDAGCICVRDRNDSDALVTGGPRFRALPVFDPSTFRWYSNRENFEVTHFVGVFIDGVTGPRNNPRIEVRIMPIAGVGIGSRHAGPLVKVLRLVE